MRLPTGNFGLLAPGLILAWLLVCAWQDVRRREISNWLTLPPLCAAAIWRVATGDWTAPVLLLTLLAASGCQRTWRWGLTAAALAGLAPFAAGEAMPAILGIFVSWAGWELGAFGAADAKLLLTLALLFPSPTLLISLALANGALGLFGLLTHRRTLPMAAAIAGGTAAFMGFQIIMAEV